VHPGANVPEAAMVTAFLASHVLELVVMAMLLVFSAFFSGTETALFNLTGGQLEMLAQSRRSRWRIVARLMRSPRKALNTILFGNMLVNVAFASLSAYLVHQLHLEGYPAWLVMPFSLAPLIVLILLGEVTPKVLAIFLGLRWAVTAGPVLAAIQRGIAPVIHVMDWLLIHPLTRVIAYRPANDSAVTGEELVELLELSAKQGVIDHDTGGMLQEVLELTDLHVADIMVPRVDMVCFDVDGSGQDLLELFRRTGLRKIPVYEGTSDNVTGIVNAKQLLLSPEADLRKLVRPALFVPETANLEQLLVQFRQTDRQMALVVDEYGGTAGLVSLEDVLEEIVGELPDASGQQLHAPVQRISDREFLISGDLGVHQWADVFKIDIDSARISTLGGFVTSRIGRLAQVGDVVTYANLRFTVEAMRQRRIERLRLELLPRRPEAA
jgi:CBS domain containing-hemolysin-like protein